MSVGNWNSSPYYSSGDIVVGHDGSMYRAVQTNQGIDPTIYNNSWVQVGHQSRAEPSSLLKGAIPAPRMSLGWNGGVAAEQNDLNQPLSIPSGTNAPVAFNTFYSPGTGDTMGYPAVSDNYLISSEFLLNINQGGWYQISATISFNESLTTDGTLGIGGGMNGAYTYLPVGIMSMVMNPYVDYIPAGNSIFFGIVAGLQDMNAVLSYANVAFVPLFNLED